MVSECAPAHVSIELTVKSPSGPLLLQGRLLALRPRKAELAVIRPAHDRLAFPTPDLEKGAPVAAVVKDEDGNVLDIVPSRVKETSGQADPVACLIVEFSRRPNLFRERRSARRVPCDIAVTFVPIAYGGKRIAPAKGLAGRLFDISTHGAKLATALSLPVGLLVELRLKPSGRQSKVIAKVVNRRAERGEIRYGLRFTGHADTRPPAHRGDV